MQSHQDTAVGCLHIPSIIPFTLQPHDITLRDETLQDSMAHGEIPASVSILKPPKCLNRDRDNEA